LKDKVFNLMAFLLKSDEKIENDYTYELSGDEDDRLRLEYIYNDYIYNDHCKLRFIQRFL